MKLVPSAVTALVSVRSFLMSRPELSVDLSWLAYELRGVLADFDIEMLEADRLVRCFRDLEAMRAAASKRGHNRIADRAAKAINDLHWASLSHAGYVLWDGARYGVHFQNVWRTVVFCNVGSYVVVPNGLESSVIKHGTISRALNETDDAEERALILAVVDESRKVHAMHAAQA